MIISWRKIYQPSFQIWEIILKNFHYVSIILHTVYCCCCCWWWWFEKNQLLLIHFCLFLPPPRWFKNDQYQKMATTIYFIPSVSQTNKTKKKMISAIVFWKHLKNTIHKILQTTYTQTPISFPECFQMIGQRLVNWFFWMCHKMLALQVHYQQHFSVKPQNYKNYKFKGLEW